MSRSNRLALAITFLFIVSCGGGGGGDAGGQQPAFTVSTNAGAGGTIFPTIRTVSSGETATFTVTPNGSFGIVGVAGCGGSLNGSTYTTGAITADCTVSANFAALPTVVAGFDAFVTINTPYTFQTCSVTGAPPLTYAWSLDTDACGAGTLHSAATATPDLAPTLYGDCVVSVSVTDANGLGSAPDSVTITAVATALTDTTAGGATVDGTVNAGEYGASTHGINTGFGDVIGAASLLSVESTSTGTVQFALESGGGSLNDYVVIYIDSAAGGFGDTLSFSDSPDPFRQAVSATNGTDRNDLSFPAGFEADYAIALNKDSAFLYQLDATSHSYKSSLGLQPAGDASAGAWEFSLDLADIGLTPGASFRYFATYLLAANMIRSDEFQGVAASTIPSGNISAGGTTPLGAHDFIVFTSYRACN